MEEQQTHAEEFIMMRITVLSYCIFWQILHLSPEVYARGAGAASKLANTAGLPRAGLLTPADMAMHLDYYQLTMGQTDFDVRNEATITANYYVRKIPQGAYLVTAGLEQVIHYILNLEFSPETIRWLSEKGDLRSAYLAELENFKFNGSVYAVPEGTVVFPNEPLINITGKSRDVQLFETYLLAVMNFQTLVATKSSRIAHAAQGRAFYDFGARRAHGRDAGVLAARAAYIGGADGTSLVSAAQHFDIPQVGTMAHKFVSERDTELEAFRTYAQSFPHNTTLLLDTYDTIEGARNACTVAHEMAARGEQLRCVRLDSGDLLALSQQVRAMLDAEGLDYVKIIASNDLDEFRIAQLIKDGAAIDSFGVGTRLATAANYNSDTDEGGVSALAGVYKLVERNGKPMGKRSQDEPEKATLPARKQVFRLSDPAGNFLDDSIVPWPAPPTPDMMAAIKAASRIMQNHQGRKAQLIWEELLVPIIQNGELVYHFPTLAEVREHTRQQLTRLGEEHKDLQQAEPYEVEVHPELQKLLKP